MNKTKLYGLKVMQVGQSVRLPKGWDMQHARVAASDYGRRHNKVFTCRMQEDGSMLIVRCDITQRDIDRRGRNSHRIIPSTEIMTLAHVDTPTKEQFFQWLDTFTSGQQYTMGLHYTSQYGTWVQWCVEYSITNSHGARFSTTVDINGALIIIHN